MFVSVTFFVISFLGDYLGYFLFQKFLDSGKKDYLTLVCAIIAAAACWFFIFGLQIRGYGLRVLIPLWASGTAVFGYFASSLVTGTPLKEIFNPISILCVIAIGIGIFFLIQRIS